MTRELTWRGLIIGCAITLVFTAANVYFGLRTGLTFATSIPAAVISMALLYRFNSSLAENNIVQTLASSAGTLSAVIFVLPALVMIGWWQHFPYVVSFGICLLGGLLGVAWSTPLRRVLVAGSDLPYPEGVACAEVLQLGTAEPHGPDHKHNLLALIAGAAIAAGLALIQATGLAASRLAVWFQSRHGIYGAGIDLSFALFAIGYLVGPAVGIAMLVGMLLNLLFALPHYTLTITDAPLASQVAMALSQDVRYIGVGCIGITAIWTLLTLLRPLWQGLASLIDRHAQPARTEKDLPLAAIALLVLACLPFIAWLLGDFLATTGLPASLWLIAGALLFILASGLLIATVCGYMAGLIGSSNSPLSGVGILVIVAASALLLPLRLALPDTSSTALAAFALIVTAIIFASATLANDNLQDLKTGQLVGATPWKQQLALIVGVIAGAIVIPWVLNLLAAAYGFQGAAEAGSNALEAPQARIIATLATGVLAQQLPWAPLLAGAGIGVVFILLDAWLRRASRFQLPPLAVGLGLYLAPPSIAMIALGALCAGWLGRGRNQQAQAPLLLAAGMIVGESLVGILLASLIVGSGEAQPLLLEQLLPGQPPLTSWLGIGLFLLLLCACRPWLRRERA